MKNIEIDDKKIGHRIYFARHDKHLSCDDLAEQTNLSPDFIRRIERGSRRCSYEALVRICVALELTTDYVLLGKDPEIEKVAVICEYLEYQLDCVRRAAHEPRFLT